MVITDRLGSYDWLPAHRRQLCWAHLLRDFQGLIDADGPGRGAAETLKTCAETLFHHWRRFRQKTISQSTLRRHLFDQLTEEQLEHLGDINARLLEHLLPLADGRGDRKRNRRRGAAA